MERNSHHDLPCLESESAPLPENTTLFQVIVIHGEFQDMTILLHIIELFKTVTSTSIYESPFLLMV